MYLKLRNPPNLELKLLGLEIELLNLQFPQLNLNLEPRLYPGSAPGHQTPTKIGTAWENAFEELQKNAKDQPSSSFEKREENNGRSTNIFIENINIYFEGGAKRPEPQSFSVQKISEATLPKKAENQGPQIQTIQNQPAARAPIASVPAAPEPIESAEPIISYIDFAFPELLRQGLNGKALYKQFSKEVKRDVIHHLYSLELAGDIEKRVEKAFKKNLHKKGERDIEALYLNELRTLDRELSSTAHTDAQQHGEEILKLYYLGTPFTNPALFAKKVSEFPPKKRFLGYMHELAIAAEVEGAANQHNWARKHYKNPHFAHLTVQALERYLHTPA